MLTENTMATTMSPQAMHDIIERRDETYIGAFFVAVTTTGIFCRPGCPAKTPHAENCEYFRTAKDAMLAGYRPCKRCTPLTAPPGAPLWAEQLVRKMNDHPERSLTAADAREAGVHPSTAARFFKARLGTTFQGLSRARRVGVALATLRAGAPIARAQLDGGFASESGFRKAVEDLFGVTPSEAASSGLAPLVAEWIPTPVGAMVAAASERGVCLLEFTDRRMLATNLQRIVKRMGRPVAPGTNDHLRVMRKELDEYFTGNRADFHVPLDVAGTPFQERVWAELRAIPNGQTISYAELARRIDQPSAFRAVARANGDNRIAIVIPCHRVISSDGTLGGYGGGLWRKQWLLEHEGAGNKSQRLPFTSDDARK